MVTPKTGDKPTRRAHNIVEQIVVRSDLTGTNRGHDGVQCGQIVSCRAKYVNEFHHKAIKTKTERDKQLSNY